MRKNILGVSPYAEQFYGVAVEQLKKTFRENPSCENLEIELKYAEFKYFCPGGFLEEFHNADPNLVERAYKHVQFQNTAFYDSLCCMSSQFLLFLNPLGRRIYRLSSGFAEKNHRKFYHIKQFFVKLCAQNANRNSPPNIYQEISYYGKNSEFRMVEESEMRLDLYVRDKAPEHLRGRYSYSPKAGWKKVNKQSLLCDQLDFMLSSRTFRMAINNQTQVDAKPEELIGLQKLVASNPKSVEMRFKNTMRVAKAYSEFSLSEIYEPTEWLPVFPDLADRLLKDRSELNSYLRRKFLIFYSLSSSETTFEIESQFTKTGLKAMQKLAAEERYSELKGELQLAIDDMYALYFVDHNTKVREVGWLAELGDGVLPEARLQNQSGDYMRQILYARMTQSKK